ncbi:hypothetical protein ACWEV9_14140, partial [Streptomyces albogriseolus]
MEDAGSLLVIVDAANVVGSVPDGWWRDRRGAAERLRDHLAAQGVPGHEGPVDIVLVVEGAARGVEPVPGVRAHQPFHGRSHGPRTGPNMLRPMTKARAEPSRS